jgi:hypothetical protein
VSPAARHLLAALTLFVALPTVALGADSVCLKGPPKPVDPRFANELRPNQTAQCPYGFDELIERLTKLAVNKHSPDSVESVEKALGLPEMTTSYDDPRIASYMMSLSGKDGWKLLVWVREAFYPLNKGPDRFVPGLRPKRLHKVSDARLIVNLDMGPSPAWGSALCMPAPALFDALTKAGWKDIEFQTPPPSDGARQTPFFKYGNKTVGGADKQPVCVEHLYLGQAPAAAG